MYRRFRFFGSCQATATTARPRHFTTLLLMVFSYASIALSAAPASASFFAGFDVLQTLGPQDPQDPTSGTHTTIPADFFRQLGLPINEDVVVPLIGGDPFFLLERAVNPTAQQQLNDLLFNQETGLPFTDTIVERRGAPDEPFEMGDTATVPIELVALNLQSVAPIEVFPGHFFSMEAFGGSLLGVPQAPGQMEITKSRTDGGTFNSTLPVNVEIVPHLQTPQGPLPGELFPPFIVQQVFESRDAPWYLDPEFRRPGPQDWKIPFHEEFDGGEWNGEIQPNPPGLNVEFAAGGFVVAEIDEGGFMIRHLVKASDVGLDDPRHPTNANVFPSNPDDKANANVFQFDSSLAHGDELHFRHQAADTGAGVPDPIWELQPRSLFPQGYIFGGNIPAVDKTEADATAPDGPPFNTGLGSEDWDSQDAAPGVYRDDPSQVAIVEKHLSPTEEPLWALGMMFDVEAWGNGDHQNPHASRMVGRVYADFHDGNGPQLLGEEASNWFLTQAAVAAHGLAADAQAITDPAAGQNGYIDGNANADRGIIAGPLERPIGEIPVGTELWLEWEINENELYPGQNGNQDISSHIGLGVDNIWVYPLCAGDTDADGDIDIDDIFSGILAAGKFSQGPSGATWAEGDFDHDDDVDIDDIFEILVTGKFNQGPYVDFGHDKGNDSGGEIALATASLVAGDGVLDLVVDPATGNLSIEADNVPADITGFIVESAGMLLTGDAYTNMLGLFGEDTDEKIADLFLALAAGSTHDLGDVYTTGLSMAAILSDLSVKYTLDGISGEFSGLVSVIPEPSSLMIMLISVVGLNLRRPSQRA